MDLSGLGFLSFDVKKQLKELLLEIVNKGL